MLRLIANEPEDVPVVAAAVQDALARPRDMALRARSRTFGIELLRFQWETAGPKPPWFRIRSVLAFGDVGGVRASGLSREDAAPTPLLAIRHLPGPEAPAGEFLLTFGGGGELRLDVACVEITLMDVGPAWPTRRRPDHGTDR
jgi:hypothetical protein